MPLDTSRFFGVRQNERAFVLGCVLLALHAMAANVLVLGAVTALFLGAAQRTQLPLVYAAAAVFGAVASLVLARLSQRISRTAEVAGTFFVLAAALAGAFVLIPVLPGGFLFVVHPVTTSLATLCVVQAYGVISDCLDFEQAKRLLPTVGSGGTLGAMSASAALALVAARFGAYPLLLVAALLAAGAGGLVIWLLSRHAPRLGSQRPRAASLQPSRQAERSLSTSQLLRELLSSRLLFRFALLQALLALASVFLKFQLESTLQATFDVDRIAAFLGLFNLAANAAVLVLQTSLESRLLRRFGLGLGLASTAFVLTAGGGALFLFSGLWAVAPVRFAEHVARFSLARTAEDLVLLPVPSNLRRRARAFIASALLPAAALLASVLIVLLARAPSLALLALMPLCAAAALGLALSLRQPYLERLRDSLARRRLSFEPLAIAAHDQTLSALLASLAVSDGSLRLGLLRTLARHRLQGAELSPSATQLQHELEVELRNGQRVCLLRAALQRQPPAGLHGRAAQHELDYLAERVLESLFLLLMLAHDPEAVQRAHLSYTRGDRHVRAFGLELLTHLLPAPQRKELMPYLATAEPQAQLARAERALGVTHTAPLRELFGEPTAARLRPLALYLAVIPPADPDEERLMASLEEVLILRSAPLFSQLSPEELQSIAEIAKREQLSAGQSVFREGDPGRAFYVILRGELSVERNGVHVATLGDGDCFGELALLDRGLRTASVVANSDCELSCIGDEDFRDLLERYPSIAMHMLAVLARRNASLLERTSSV